MPISQHKGGLKTGLKGLAQNWRADLIAAISVSLVAMPLGLAIALACGVPPISGIFSAVIGGIVTTLIRGSHIAINGPTASLIAVILAATIGFNDGDGRAFNYVMAAVVVAGAIQLVLGFFKLSRFAEIFPSAVITGILAAIGIITMASQINLATDTAKFLPEQTSTIEKFTYFVQFLPQLNIPITIISLLGLLLLIFHSKISYKLFHLLPAPIWVLLVSIPLFMVFQNYGAALFGSVDLGADDLINVPSDITSILKLIPYPDFGKINTSLFWITVVSISLIATIETLAAAKAIDKLDPYHRKTNLNKDLMAIGASTMLAGFVGGLPIISVIVRTTVNIHNNARTKWSNFFHGVLLVLYVLVFSKYLQMIPLAALAAILIFVGYKLTAPRLFKESYKQGMEQLLFMTGTLLITLYTNLIVGIIGGILLTLVIHILLARLPFTVFFGMLFKSGTKLLQKNTNSYELRIKGVANFLSILHLKKVISEIPAGADIKINVSSTRILDLTVQEFLYDFKKEHARTGGKVRITGMEHHIASSTHKLALKSLLAQAPVRLTPRQQRIRKLAVKNKWLYRQEVEWDISSLQDFDFFETRPLEYKENVISGTFPDSDNIQWVISDLTFDEGALTAKEVFHTTVEVIHLNKEIPVFVLEQEGFFDKIFERVMAFRGQADIDFPDYPDFSKRFMLRGDDSEHLGKFFTEPVIEFLLSKDVYHIESNGNSLLIFRSLRVARTEDIKQMIAFSKDFVKLIE